MAQQDPRGNALTIEDSAGNQVTNPLLRIASQAMNDMQRKWQAMPETPGRK
jgi:hypothetical protein